MLTYLHAYLQVLIYMLRCLDVYVLRCLCAYLLKCLDAFIILFVCEEWEEILFI